MARRVVAQEVITYEAETEKMVKALERARKKVEQLEQTVRERGRAMATESDNNVATMIVSFNKVSFGVTRVINRIRRISEALRFAGRVLIGSWVGPVTEAVKAAGKFSLTMAGVQTVMPRTGVAVDELKEKVFELSAVLGRTAEETGQGLFKIFQAGVTETTGAVDLLTAAGKLSVAGFVAQEQAVDGMTSVLHAYSASMSEAHVVSDIFFSAARLGKTSIEELNQSIGYVAGSAADAGINFSEVAAALAVMTNAGVQTDKAAIGLNQILTALRKVTPQAAAEAKRLGIEFNLAAVRSKGLANFILEIASNSELTDQSLGRLFGNVRALRAFFGLARENGEAFREVLNGIAQSGGETEKALLVVQQALGHQIKAFEAAVENTKVAFGNLVGETLQLDRVLKSITKVLNDAAKKFNAGDEEAKKLVAQISALVNVFGQLAIALTQVILLATALTSAFVAITTEFFITSDGAKKFSKELTDAANSALSLRERLKGVSDELSAINARAQAGLPDSPLLKTPEEEFEHFAKRLARLQKRSQSVVSALESGKILGRSLTSAEIEAGQQKLLEIDDQMIRLQEQAKKAGIDIEALFRRAAAIRGVSGDILAPPGGLPTEPPTEKGPRINIGDLLKRVDTMFEQLERKTQEGLDKINQIGLRAEDMYVVDARRLFNERLAILKSEIRQTQELIAQRTAIRASLEKRLNEAVKAKSKERAEILKAEIESMDNAIDQEREQLQRRIQQVTDAQKKLENAKAQSLRFARDLLGDVGSKREGLHGVIEEVGQLRRARSSFIAEEQDPQARAAGLRLFDMKAVELHARASELIREENEKVAESFHRVAVAAIEEFGQALIDLSFESMSTSDFLKTLARIIIKSLLDIGQAYVQAAAQRQLAAQANILVSSAEGAAGIGSQISEDPSIPWYVKIGLVPAISGLIFGILSAFVNKFAQGGLVKGGVRGHDSVPALLMPGEFVLPAGVVNDIRRGRPPGMFSGAQLWAGDGGGGGVVVEQNVVLAPQIQQLVPDRDVNFRRAMKDNVIPELSRLARDGEVIRPTRQFGPKRARN